MSELFRKKALDKLAVPDRLDECVALIAPRWWTTLAALFAVLCAAALWGGFGQISATVDGSGMLMAPDGIRNVAAPSEGILAQFLVAEGDAVQEGQAIAKLASALVASPAGGTIVAILKSVGDPVSAGDALCLLQPSSGDALRVFALLPAARGMNVRPGQPAFVAPANVDPRRTGYLRGSVRRVGRYPATLEQVANVFKNRELAQYLKNDPAAVLAEIALDPSPRNPAEFQWTGKAPDGVPVLAGTLCRVSVVVERRAPLSYVLPWMRET